MNISKEEEKYIRVLDRAYEMQDQLRRSLRIYQQALLKACNYDSNLFNEFLSYTESLSTEQRKYNDA